MDDPIRRYRNVKDQGAKGDGATDDRAAIQAAINLAAPRPGVTIDVIGVKEPLVFRNVGKCGKPGSWMGCGKMIWWCTTSSGHPMPVDPEPLPDGRYQSHFASCPHAKHFRQR